MTLTKEEQNESEDDDGPYLAAILRLEQLGQRGRDDIHLIARIVHLVAQAVQQRVLLLHLVVNILANGAQAIHCHAQALQGGVLLLDHALGLLLLVLHEVSVAARHGVRAEVRTTATLVLFQPLAYGGGVETRLQS